jgi:HEAT repeat protein
MEVQSESLVGLFTTDINLNIGIWDSALERMTGIGHEDAIGRSVLDLIPGLRDRAPVLARFEQTLKGGTIEILAPTFHQFLIPCPPLFQSQHFAEMRQQTRIAPLLDDDTVCGLIVTVEDVTRRMENEIAFATALRSPDPSVRLEAARELSAADDPLDGNIAAPVIEGLDDSDWKVRRKLVDSMARRGGADAIEALLRAMRDKHMNFGVVNGALQILRASAIDTSAQLVEFLRSNDTDLRMHSALALGEQRDPGVVPHLIEALGDEDANVRYHVVEALGKLRAAPALDDLIEIAEARDFFMSFAALDAIAEIGESRAADRIVPLLRDEGLQDAALSTLGRVGRPSDIAVIVALLDADESSTVPVADAAVALYQRHHGDLEHIEAVLSGARENITDAGRARLADALRSEDIGALQSLIPFSGWFPDRSISDALSVLLKRPELREKALSAILMQGETAVDPLIECLASEDDEVRAYAARALGTIGSERAVDPLTDFLENGSPEDVQAAIDAFGSIDDPRSADLLAELLSDPDPNTREHALRSLGRLANPDFRDEILSKAKDSDEMVRQAAIEQVPLIAGHSGLPILLESIEGDTPRVRAAAARALAQLQHQDSIGPLRKALDDPDAWTRYFAVRGIGALRDIASAERLRDLSETDPAQQVRMAAREVASELGT